MKRNKGFQSGFSMLLLVAFLASIVWTAGLKADDAVGTCRPPAPKPKKTCEERFAAAKGPCVSIRIQLCQERESRFQNLAEERKETNQKEAQERQALEKSYNPRIWKTKDLDQRLELLEELFNKESQLLDQRLQIEDGFARQGLKSDQDLRRKETREIFQCQKEYREQSKKGNSSQPGSSPPQKQ